MSRHPIYLAGILAMALPNALSAAESPGVRVDWRVASPLPDPVGLKGMYAGIGGGWIFLAGGSNFPVPQREGGKKTYHRAIYRREVNAALDAPWTQARDELPVACGEGASVTTPEGMIWLGGHDGVAPLAAVRRVRWEPTAQRLAFTPLPDLPEPVTNASAAWHDGWIYVAGGEARTGGRRTLWRLNLAQAIADPSRTRWEVLADIPGRPRTGCILIAVTTDGGPGLLCGGGVHGPAKTQADYLTDAHLYRVADGRWVPAAALPRGAVLASTVVVDASRVLVLGGSDGHDFARMKELGERYRIPSDVLLYDARRNQWSAAGTMPLGTVGAAVVPVNDGWLIAGGEHSPGLRTPQVFHLRLSTPPATP